MPKLLSHAAAWLLGAAFLPLGLACGGRSLNLVVADDASADASPSKTDAGASIMLDCTPDARAAMPVVVDLSVKDTLRGTNGVFVDSCDDHGNLIDYACETENVCTQELNGFCAAYDTGRVVPNDIDCSGHCTGGTCDGRCPNFKQQVTYAAVGADGAATIHNDTDGRTYACTLSSSQDPSVTFDCVQGPHPGLQGIIEALGLHGTPCTGKAFGGIQVRIDGFASTDDENCSYDCSIP